MTESKVVQILQDGSRGEQRLMEQRRRLIAEQESIRVAARDWEKLDPDMAEQLRSTYMNEADIEQLRAEELEFRRVRHALYIIGAEDRMLLISYYEENRTPEEIAGKLCVSRATFWRRRRAAMRALLSACGRAGSERCAF